MSLRIDLDPSEFSELIQSAADAAVRRLAEERPTDETGRVLLTKAEAAKTLSMSSATLDRLRRDAGLPCLKLDGLVLFRPESLDAWAKEREANS